MEKHLLWHVVCMWLEMSFKLWSYSSSAPLITVLKQMDVLFCPGVGFRLTPNRRDWTGWKNSTRLFWTFTHGTEHQRRKQKVSSQTHPAVGTWGRAYCNCITLLKPVCYLLRCNFSQFLQRGVHEGVLEAAFMWNVDDKLTSGFICFVSELQEMSCFIRSA